MASPATPDDVIRRVVAALDRAGVPYMLTGSFASSLHGAPRATQDVDFVVAPTPATLERLLDEFPEREYYVSRDAARRAIHGGGLFNVIDRASGWKIDLIFRKQREFSKVEFERRTTADVLGITIRVATPEDTLLAKLEWSKHSGSERQVEDAVAILRTQGADLDTAYIDRWVARLGLESQWSRAKEKAA